MSATHSRKEIIPSLVADVFELAGAFQQSSDALAQIAGQTGARWQVMWVADESRCTVPDIARRLGRSRQAVQRVADLLVAERLAEWHRNPGHRRSSLLNLTPAGQDSLRRIMRASDIWRSTLVDGFTVAELESAREIIRRVAARVVEVPIQPSRVGAASDSGAPVRDTGSALGVPENF
jgi:DNA-binding MarR family transcriptional regulator